ncbi:hypothetical protein [Sorangium sp. So ce542]|uniref:hypothetical protein n=1 Tax=Sorangium sp. So ce542 TaxID=3133316 RepID=UPI003F5F3A80
MTTLKHGARLVAFTVLTSIAPGSGIASTADPTETEGPVFEGDSSMVPSEILGTVEQEDRIGRGWHMKTQATLRSDGTATGFTELRNSRFAWGYMGGLVVVIVDAQKQPLAYVPVDRWGIDACAPRCPRKRYVTWTASVPSHEWSHVGRSARGLALYQFHDPKGVPWPDVVRGLSQALPLIRSLAVLF